MTRIDPVIAVTWGAILLLVVVFWTMVLFLLLPGIEASWEAARSLDGCDAYRAEIVACAEGR